MQSGLKTTMISAQKISWKQAHITLPQPCATLRMMNIAPVCLFCFVFVFRISSDASSLGFLSCAIDNAWRVGKIPIGLPLDLMDKMNEAKPKMLRIWKDSPFARQGRDTLIATSMEREKNLRNALSNGLTRDDFVGGQWGSD